MLDRKTRNYLPWTRHIFQACLPGSCPQFPQQLYLLHKPPWTLDELGSVRMGCPRPIQVTWAITNHKTIWHFFCKVSSSSKFGLFKQPWSSSINLFFSNLARQPINMQRGCCKCCSESIFLSWSNLFGPDHVPTHCMWHCLASPNSNWRHEWKQCCNTSSPSISWFTNKVRAAERMRWLEAEDGKITKSRMTLLWFRTLPLSLFCFFGHCNNCARKNGTCGNVSSANSSAIMICKHIERLYPHKLAMYLLRVDLVSEAQHKP